jgi:hypothetical protein
MYMPKSLIKTVAVLIGIALGVTALYYFIAAPTWSELARGAVVIVIVITLPLLRALGVFGSLPKNPQSTFRPWQMLKAAACLAGAPLWVALSVRHASGSTAGQLFVWAPAFVLFVTAIFYAIKSKSPF